MATTRSKTAPATKSAPAAQPAAPAAPDLGKAIDMAHAAVSVAEQVASAQLPPPQPKTSALGALRALANKAPVASAPGLTAQLTDPAISGAKRDKNTVKLGMDPRFSERAAYGAEMKAALERATADFEVVQAELRDYGKDKRALYNKTFKCVVTTMGVPYQFVERDADGNAIPGTEEIRYVQVICSNKYSVQKDIVLANQEAMGDLFNQLFIVETEKKLKPNAEEIVRGLLTEQGVQGQELEDCMDSLFDTERKVKTTEGFEQISETAPAGVKAILDQAVTRSQPGLKFPS